MYELWDLTTRNVSGFFDSKPAALEAVRDAVKTHGRGYAEAFSLLYEDAGGRCRQIASGADLIDLALRAGAGTPHRAHADKTSRMAK